MSQATQGLKRKPRRASSAKLEPPPPVRESGDAVGYVAAALIGVALTAFLIRWGNVYPKELLRYWLIGGAAVAAATIGLVLRLRSKPFDVAALRHPSPLVFASSVGGLAFALSLAASFWIFGNSPSTSDEVAQAWHAKMILSGHWALPVDPNPEFFSVENVVDIGRWYSQYPVGGPIVVALGLWLRTPWLINPVLVALSCIATYLFCRRVFGESEGRVTTLLFALSPMIVFMAGTQMNHVPTLFLVTVALLALGEWDRASSFRTAAISASILGAAIGAMATIRPLDAVVVAVVVGLFQVSRQTEDRWRWPTLGLQAVCGLIALSPLLYANWITTGHPLRFGYEVLWGPGHRIGFHVDPYNRPHTIARGFEYAAAYLSELNSTVLAWPIPILPIAAAGLIAQARSSRWDRLVLGLLGAQVAAYAAYWFYGEFLGPRFLYTCLPSVLILVARTPYLLGERFGEKWRLAAIAGFTVCLIQAWAVPGISFNALGLAKQIRQTRGALKLDVAGAISSANVHHAVIFLREPLSFQLSRRLWGVGFSRAEASRLVGSTDGCGLLLALNAADSQPALSQTLKQRVIESLPRDTVRGALLPTSESTICQQELDRDRQFGGVSFGSALPLEPIDASGRIAGDVIYAADLGQHNEVLRSRFGDRNWYRLVATKGDDGRLIASVKPY